MSVGEAEVTRQVQAARLSMDNGAPKRAHMEALLAIALAIQNLATVIAHKGDMPTVYGGPR